MIYINQRRKALRRWFLISEYSPGAASPNLGIDGIRSYRARVLPSIQITVRRLLYRQYLAGIHPIDRLLRCAFNLAEAQFYKIFQLLRVVAVVEGMMR